MFHQPNSFNSNLFHIPMDMAAMDHFPNQIEQISAPHPIPFQDNSQDAFTEVINISKIKDGFFIGDKLAAISIDVIIQFKITHFINATGSQIMNQWESLGISYLTLNWSENERQILFDSKDEIANRIVQFIDNSLVEGEGLLAHSFKGQNRVCIVVLIYLMKKYKWSLNKSLDYLKSKKNDVDIVPYFYVQLMKFEERLKQRGELNNDIPWTSTFLLKDKEEKLICNTYMNGLPSEKDNLPSRIMSSNTERIRHIIWNDENPAQKGPLEIIDKEHDLFFEHDIRPITSHQRIRPNKKCIKYNRNNNNGNKIGIYDNNLNKNEIGSINNYIDNNNKFGVKFENINMNISNNQLYENNKNNATAYNISSMNSLNPSNLKNYNLSNNNNINNLNKQINKNAINFNENNNYNSNDINKNPNMKKKNMSINRNNMNSHNNGKIKKNSINKKYDKNNNLNNPHNKANDMNSNIQGKPLYNSMNDFFNKRHNIENINSNINNIYTNHPLIEDLYGNNFEYIKHNNNTFLSNNNHKNTNINNNKISKSSYAINYNNNNIHNTYSGYTKNKPLNNFNPNLIKKKEVQTPVGQTLLNRNKSNLEEGPVKIKKNNYIKNLNNNHTEHNQSSKKPISPELNHYGTNGYSSENNNNYNSNHSMKKTNSSSILGSRTAFMKQNDSNSGIFVYDKKNNVKNKFNNNFIKRPSTAPHKDKVKVPSGLVNKKNYKISDKKPKITKYNQRPQSAEGGGKKNMHKNYNTTNNFINNINNINGRMGITKNLSNSNVAGEMNNSKEYRINSIKNSVQNKGINSGNTNIYNKNLFVGSNANPKYRMPSPMIKTTNIQKNTGINNGRKFAQIKSII